ncbi:MAG: gluconate 2-dehydrogenase subunit 3 family protein [Vicinamibacteraceae bacterium]
MAEITRRNAVRVLAAAPLAGGFTWAETEVQTAHQHAQQAVSEADGPFKPSFFTDHEYQTVRVLADLIIPRDERSGSASDAGVPEFIDFIMSDEKLYSSTPNTARQTAMRGGVAWLDRYCEHVFDRRFIECSDSQRTQVLDSLAWPAKARPELQHGVSFFSSFRDLTATGFWSSKMGVEDLQYMGNVFVAEWKGCPEEALKKLGVAYDD